MTIRYAEHFLCDAIRLATYLAREKGVITDGIGHADDFPLVPKDRELVDEDVRFVAVDEMLHYEIAYVSTDKPTKEDAKFRNKNLYRIMIGREITLARLEMGLTIDDLAEKTNLRPRSLQRIEEGRWDLDISLLGVIMNALDKELKFV